SATRSPGKRSAPGASHEAVVEEPGRTVIPDAAFGLIRATKARRPPLSHGERGSTKRQALCSELRFDAEGDRVGAVELDVVPAVVVVVRIRVDVGGVDQVEVDVAAE